MNDKQKTDWSDGLRKLTSDQCIMLDITWLLHKGLFNQPFTKGTLNFESGSFDFVADTRTNCDLRLTIRSAKSNKEQERHIEQDIRLELTMPYYGGIRWWFLCPTCSRRCGILYLPIGLNQLGCRHCHGVTYRRFRKHYDSNFTDHEEPEVVIHSLV